MGSTNDMTTPTSMGNHGGTVTSCSPYAYPGFAEICILLRTWSTVAPGTYELAFLIKKKPARRLEMQRDLFVVMCLGSPVVLSCLDAGFEPRCGLKDFWGACCLLLLLLLLLLAKTCSSSLAPKRWCKTSTG